MPSACAAKLASGEVDVGLIPSIEYQRIPGLQRRARRSASRPPRRCARCCSSRTSRARRSARSTLDPGLADLGGADADPAQARLRARAGVPGGGRREAGGRAGGRAADHRRPRAEDAAERPRRPRPGALWRSFSGHPFVFAFWAMREAAASAEVAALLRRSYEAGVAALRRDRARGGGRVRPLRGGRRGLPAPRAPLRARRAATSRACGSSTGSPPKRG